MAVAAVGELQLVPCAGLSPRDPQTMVWGLGSAAGDASGGAIVVTFTFPRNMAVLVKAVYGHAAGALTACEFQLRPGLIIAGSQVILRSTSVIATPIGTARGHTWHPAAFLTVSEAAVQVLVSIDNGAAESLSAYLVALAWSRDVISKFSPTELGQRFT